MHTNTSFFIISARLTGKGCAFGAGYRRTLFYLG